MKLTACLINVSRGALIDEDALIGAMRAGRIAGAGLDVTTVDPIPAESPLWACPTTRMATPWSEWSSIFPSHSYANPALFLASDAASFVTGSNIVVDGGRTATTHGCYDEL